LNCSIPEGEAGACRVRANVGGVVRLQTYGRVTTMMAGPVEQKPFYHFFPGMRILSIGGSGCNLFCKFCQNYEISQVGKFGGETRTPDDVVQAAVQHGAAGVAFTYSEPVVWMEYVIDVAKACRASGLKTMLKTNGFASERAFGDICEHMDAVNVDLKGDAESYLSVCGVRMDGPPRSWPVVRNLALAARACHLEMSLISIPGRDAMLDEVLGAAASAAGELTPVHVLRFVPDFAMRGAEPASAGHMSSVVRKAKVFFRYVYENLPGSDTVTCCCMCQAPVLIRKGVLVVESNLTLGGACQACGARQRIRVGP
jgi:pyruvate formate lyase activating enzyme